MGPTTEIACIARCVAAEADGPETSHRERTLISLTISAVTHRIRRRLTLALALFGWLAQMCLPVAHAAVMAEARTGGDAWCGPSSPALQAELAKLPQDIREILGKGTPQSSAHLDCMQFCASSGGMAMTPEPVTVVLRAAGLEEVPTSVTPPARRALAAPPPARGPPLFS